MSVETESKLLMGYFEQHKISKNTTKNDVCYVAIVDGKWDMKYYFDPYDESKPAVLELDFGLLPIDEGKKQKTISSILSWNHTCVKRHGYGAELIDEGNRLVLKRYVANNKIDDEEMNKNLKIFINLGRSLDQIRNQANETVPANARYL